jgi:hypothetical protein
LTDRFCITWTGGFDPLPSFDALET